MRNEALSVTKQKHSQIQIKNATKMTLIVLTLLGVAHVALGSNPIVPVLAVLTVALAMWPMARYGAMNITAILILLVAMRYVGFPLFAKLAMRQALDTHLDQPIEAYAAVTLGILSYLSAVVLANRIGTGQSVLKPLTEPRALRRLSFVAFIVGFIANMDMSLQIYTESDAVTISNFFTSFLHLSLIAAASAVLVRSNGRRTVDSWTLIIFATEVAFAFAANARTPIMEAFLCLVMTAAAFQGRVSRKQIAGAVAMFLVLVVLTPAFLGVRGTRGDLGMYERVGATIEALTDWEVTRSAFIDSMEEEASNPGFFMRYYGAPSNILERFSHVNDVDVLISGTDNNRTLGFEVFRQAVERALPRFIARDKPRDYGEGDWIYCELGVKCLYGNYLTAALIGTGYAAFSWAGVIAFPFMLGLPLLLLIKKAVGFNMVGNVWAIYMLVTFNNRFVEGGVASYIATMFRQLPQDLVVMFVLAGLVGARRIVLRKPN